MVASRSLARSIAPKTNTPTTPMIEAMIVITIMISTRVIPRADLMLAAALSISSRRFMIFMVLLLVFKRASKRAVCATSLRLIVQRGQNARMTSHHRLVELQNRYHDGEHNHRHRHTQPHNHQGLQNLGHRLNTNVGLLGVTDRHVLQHLLE